MLGFHVKTGYSWPDENLTNFFFYYLKNYLKRAIVLNLIVNLFFVIVVILQNQYETRRDYQNKKISFKMF